jgi:hypothetical protein
MGYLFIEAEGAPTRPQRRILKGGRVFRTSTEVRLLLFGQGRRPDNRKGLILEPEGHAHAGEGVNLVFLKDFQEVP